MNTESPNLSIDILDKIFRYVDSIKLIAPFGEYMHNNTKQHLLRYISVVQTTILTVRISWEVGHTLDWYAISKRPLSYEFIVAFHHMLQWKKVCKCSWLPEALIIKFKDYVYWRIISKHQRLTESFIHIYRNLLDWQLISRYQALSDHFINNNENMVYWPYICRYQLLSERCIIKNEHHIFKVYDDINEYGNIFKYQKMSESLIVRLVNKFPDFNRSTIDQRDYEFYVGIIWKLVGQYQVLSEIFMNTYFNRLDNAIIVQYQAMSEMFIYKYSTCLDWKYISQYQVLSETFIYENSCRLHWRLLSRYQKFSNKLMVDFIDMVDWQYAVRYQVIDEAVLMKYLAKFSRHQLCDNIDWYSLMYHQKLSKKFKDHYSFYNNIVLW